MVSVETRVYHDITSSRRLGLFRPGAKPAPGQKNCFAEGKNIWASAESSFYPVDQNENYFQACTIAAGRAMITPMAAVSHGGGCNELLTLTMQFFRWRKTWQLQILVESCPQVVFAFSTRRKSLWSRFPSKRCKPVNCSLRSRYQNSASVGPSWSNFYGGSKILAQQSSLFHKQYLRKRLLGAWLEGFAVPNHLFRLLLGKSCQSSSIFHVWTNVSALQLHRCSRIAKVVEHRRETTRLTYSSWMPEFWTVMIYRYIESVFSQRTHITFWKVGAKCFRFLLWAGSSHVFCHGFPLPSIVCTLVPFLNTWTHHRASKTCQIP